MIRKSPKRIKTKKDPKGAYLKRKYGITLEDYNVMMERQEGKCAICLKQKKLAVDHCHHSGIVRGLLCLSCNVSIGHFMEDVGSFRRAIDYINQGRLTHKHKIELMDEALESIL